MRKWVKPFVFLLLSVASLLLLFKFCGVTANAADVVYRQMSLADSYAFYGDSIQCTYYSTTGYKQVTLYPSSGRYGYHKTGTMDFGTGLPSWADTTSLEYCGYFAQVSDYSSNPSYLGIDISPNVHFSDCNALRFIACSYLGSYAPNQNTYSDSFIYIDSLRYGTLSYVDNAGYYPAIDLTRGSGYWRNLCVWADYQDDTLRNVNLMRIGFNGAQIDDGYIDVFLSCPLVNDTAVPQTGTAITSAPAPSFDVNVTVYVDNSPIQSQLDDYLGDNDTGITTYDTYNLSAFPEVDYNALTQTVDAAGVLSQSANGINAIWYVVDGLFTNVPYLVWLCPFAIFLAILSFVLWRKG